MKVITTLIALLLVCSLASCQTTEKPKELQNPSTQDTESRNTHPTTIDGAEDEEMHTTSPFSISKTDKGYVYRIYNNNVLIEEQYVAVKEPACYYITDSLIHVTAQAGTGRSTNWGFFYDYATNKRSATFQWVLDYTKSLVALGHMDRVIIRSIFDDSYYLEIIDFERPIAMVADGILSADFSEDMTTVTVTYVVEDTYDIATQVFSLT